MTTNETTDYYYSTIIITNIHFEFDGQNNAVTNKTRYNREIYTHALKQHEFRQHSAIKMSQKHNKQNIM